MQFSLGKYNHFTPFINVYIGIMHSWCAEEQKSLLIYGSISPLIRKTDSYRIQGWVNTETWQRLPMIPLVVAQCFMEIVGIFLLRIQLFQVEYNINVLNLFLNVLFFSTCKLILIIFHQCFWIFCKYQTILSV